MTTIVDPQRSQLPRKEEEEPGIWPLPRLFEGVHFYWDGELLVFTEAYHRARGSCCGSGCRHCPFDHENVPSGSE